MTTFRQHATRAVLTSVWIGVFGLRAVPASAENGASITLKQCYEWARAQNENLKSRREDILLAKARGRAALGGAYPRLEWSLVDTWQDTSGIPTFDDDSGSNVSIVDKNPVESKFSLRQPLFSGFREFSAAKGFKKQMARDEWRVVRETAQLYETTAETFYLIVSDQMNLENTRTVLKLSEDRLGELKKNLRLGKSRESEAFGAQSQAASLRAQVRHAEGKIRAGKAELAFLTGHDVSDDTVLQDEIAEPLTVGPLADYLARVATRSDLKAQREDMAAQKLRVRYEKGSFWPSADVTGNYYTRRPSFYKDIDWDVVLLLRVPLYQGGAVGANAEAALSAYRQSALMLEMLERTAKKDVTQIHNNLTTVLEEARDLEEAYEASQKNYNSQRKEYGLGLVTNLEVIEALNTLQTAKKAWDDARLAAKTLFIQLQVAVEEQP